ncbi:MAG: hypothetical protein ACI9JN_001400 [Bacteroidia bacterium]|jgi:hypothetical protein
MSNMGTAPLRVGTFYIQDTDNSEYNYFIACVELYDAPGGVTINEESIVSHVDENGLTVSTVEYSYTYNDPNPITTNTVSTYHLKMFFPEMDANGNPIIPNYIKIYNSVDAEEKKVGKMNNAPDATLNDPNYPLYQPRCLVLANQPVNPGSTLQKFVFIIANTNPEDELRLNATTNGPNIDCTTAQDTTDNGPKNASAILLPLDPTNPATAANLVNHVGIIDAANPQYFVYPEVPLQG